MPATMRQVTFNAAVFASATSTPVAASGTVRFRREHAFVSGGQFVEPGKHDAAYASGAFTAAVWLAVPDDADQAAAYTAKINGTAYPFSLAQGAAVDLSTLIALAAVEDVSAVSQLLSGYTPLPTFTTHEDLAGDAALGHVKNGGNVTINLDGTMDAAGGGAPSGPAGGVLSGTYPDPGFAADMATQAELDAETSRATAAEGVLLSNVNTRALATDLATLTTTVAGKEASLGNPAGEGWALISSIAGLRTWTNISAAYARIAADNQFTVAQGIRGAASGVAAGLHVPWVSGDTLPAIVGGSAGGSTIGVRGLTTTNQAVRGDATSGIGVYGQANASGQGVLGLSGGGQGVRGDGSTGVGVAGYVTTGVAFLGLLTGAATNAAVEASRLSRNPASGTPGALFGIKSTVLLKSSTTADQPAAEDHTVWSDAAHATRTAKRGIWLVRPVAGTPTLVEVFTLDASDSATQTNLTIYYNGAQRRVEVGAADSGGAGYRVVRILN